MLPHWRQKTPHDQLVATIGSLEGLVSNAQDGVYEYEKFLKLIAEKTDELKLLVPYLKNQSWSVV